MGNDKRLIRNLKQMFSGDKRFKNMHFKNLTFLL